ncbi:MAG: alpha/beta hydrolase [Clostridia bacterium]|nr:alpha/beta hydrolase [Clostridia bacterium]
MVIKWKIDYPCFSGKEQRNAYVYLPKEARKGARRFPVLYMFDGHNVFFDYDATYGKSWGMKEYMDKTKTPMIIAAVECNHSPNGGRLSEYSPFSFKSASFGSVIGRGEETMDWFINVFKKEIDSRFPTLPDREHTFIAGSSMGGLMSLYAISAYNNVFSKAACLSPSVWAGAKQLDDFIKNADIADDTVVYMDYGALEMGNHNSMAKRLSKVASLLVEKNIDLSFRIIPGGTHSEASWERQIPFFMKTLLYEAE